MSDYGYMATYDTQTQCLFICQTAYIITQWTHRKCSQIYMSGYRRRTASGGNASGSLSADMDQHISSPVCENHQDGETRNTGESNCLHNAAHYLEKLKKDMFDLESEIPWDCMQSNWKICHEDWLEKLKESSTIQVGKEKYLHAY